MDVDNMDFPITATLDSVDRVNEKMQSLEITEQLTGSKADFEKFKDAIVLYPAYFDARKSEKQGRRVPRDLAINTDVTKGGIPLTAWQLAMACGRLDMHVLVEERKRYPRDYWGYGRIRVKPKGSSVMKKRQLLKEIARILPTVQTEVLQSLEAKAKESGVDIPKSAYSIPISPNYFPYGNDPLASTALKYEYGALPMEDLRPKVTAKEQTSSTAGASSSSTSKKSKKNRK